MRVTTCVIVCVLQACGTSGAPCCGAEPSFVDSNFDATYAVDAAGMAALGADLVDPLDAAGCEDLCADAAGGVNVVEAVSQCDAVMNADATEVVITCVADGYFVCDFVCD